MAASPNQTLSFGAIAAAGGGVLLIIFEFLDWIGGGGVSLNAWKWFAFVDIFLLLVAIAAIALAVMSLPMVNVSLPWQPRGLTTVGIIATTTTFVELVDIVPKGADASDQVGLYLAFIASLAILAGGILLERSPQLGVAMGGGRAAAGAGYYGGGAQPPAVGQPGYGQQPPGGYGPPPGAAQPTATPGPAPGAAGAPTAFEQPIAQASPPPPDRPGQPADWYPDPKGEKRLRYWDGSQWTDHVAD